MKRFLLFVIFFAGFSTWLAAQENPDEPYKKRVLESTEIDILSSFYMQSGNNAAVTGGIGTEELKDATSSIIISVPLNDDDVLTLDGSVSAYTSASSSNINPFDGPGSPDPFVATTGASSNDVWTNLTASFTHNSDDRNFIWSLKGSVSNEFDYSSLGFGGSLARQFNSKNTELSLHSNVYLDNWRPIYPFELRSFADGGSGLNSWLFYRYSLIGNQAYSPIFNEIASTNRNSYAVGLGFTQILSKKMQGAVLADFVLQKGQLSTPYQRIYFKDIEDTFISNFQLADAIENLPDSRFKVALGGRLNYFVNEHVVLRTFYRYYLDDWGIRSNTINVEIPIKITDKFTLYPSYRFYNQTAANYFAGYEQHLSTEKYYTSDYDLSDFSANQYSFGITYTDIFTKLHIYKIGLKSLDLKYNYYRRNSAFRAQFISLGLKFVFD